MLRLFDIVDNCLFSLNRMGFYLSTFLHFCLVWPSGKFKKSYDILLMRTGQQLHRSKLTNEYSKLVITAWLSFSK